MEDGLGRVHNEQGEVRGAGHLGPVQLDHASDLSVGELALVAEVLVADRLDPDDVAVALTL